MAAFVIINSIVVVVILAFDMYRHQFQSLHFSSVLLAITTNAFINLMLLGKLTFISVFTLLMYCIWTVLQYYLNYHYQPFTIKNYKFLTGIVTIMLSIALVVVDQTADQSYYMSVPYLSPAIFAFGAILLFSSTFDSDWYRRLYRKLKIKQPLWVGTSLIIIAFIVMVALTPFWYLFVLVYGGLWVLLFIEKIF
ncbi:hypothetical protein TP70_01130 [Staphylococcus microti]|uniref:Integral membrane protein n=1 Tax=Staphylococcus microti TaxID=569857 RepID=A0A0D6XSW5_9STAP|nr:hypothetical protein [Staphylococcus microti]KIX91702.1 hypothetical protein TP70_01130 [Staphylococcus microti]PNZ84314.1 hypothetical protein CD132_00920 [Staphylococcus microti]SUM56790.1 Uncharacterised protein [Staphylococcus microti]